MLRKWLYIFSFLCLANSQPMVVGLHNQMGSTTLLDLIIGHFQDEDDDNEKTPTELSCRHFLSIVRKASLNIRIPLATIFKSISLQGMTHHFFGNHLITKPIKPSYYNFLFRLSPF